MDPEQLARAYDQLLTEFAARGVRLVYKTQSWHQRLIGLVAPAYVTRFVTTIGRTIYLTPDWSERRLEERWATLRHEAVHLAQFRRYGLIPMAIAYLLLPLPVGLAWCRMRLEREAYEESLRAWHALGGRAAVLSARQHVCAQFTSAGYGWMWPFPRAIARWFDRCIGCLR